VGCQVRARLLCIMRDFTGFLLLLPLVQATPLLADLEGSRYMSDHHSANAVPRIGRRASSEEDLGELGPFLPQYPYPHLLRESKLWSKVGKRSDEVTYYNSLPNFIKWDLARVGKRGLPSFSIPKSWRPKPRKRSPMSMLREQLYPNLKKRSAQPKDPWMGSWAHQVGGHQGFRLHDGDLDYLSRNIMYKRAEDHDRDLNSVPFIGKRAEENNAEGEDDNEILVRVPREETDDDQETDGDNPWEMMDITPQLENNIMM